jgi:hypothetical protein
MQTSADNESSCEIPPKNGQSLTIDSLRERIRKARTDWDMKAIAMQKSVVRLGKYSALLVPIAVLLLTVQIIAFTQNPPVAIPLIALELIILFIALYILFADIGPGPRGWGRARLRAEILRREELLLIARVGPYLTKGKVKDLQDIVDIRLTRIDNGGNNPIDFIRLEDSVGQPWRNALEEIPAKDSAPPESYALTEYLEKRVKEQETWYSNKSKLRERQNTILENLAKLIIAGALVLAAMHLIVLIACPTRIKLVVEILVIVLPPIGAAVAALHSFFQYKRLSRTYGYYARALTELIVPLTELQAKNNEPSLTLEDTEGFKLDFKRLVLRTEELLSSELCHWYFSMH